MCVWMDGAGDDGGEGLEEREREKKKVDPIRKPVLIHFSNIQALVFLRR